MTDLFDSLSARFAPTARPVIRPRPQSRFERTEGVPDTLGEEKTFETARAPDRPAQSPPRAAAPQPETPQRAASPRRASSGDADRNVATFPQTEAIKPPQASHRPNEPETSANTPPPPEQDTRAQTSQDGAGGPPPEPRRKTDTPSQPQGKPVQQQLDVIHNTVSMDSSDGPTQCPSPIETRIIETAPEPRESAPAAPPQVGHTIRIGRIEMRQPAPPAPAPAPPPRRPAAPAPGGPANGTARSKSGSGLTDYLGWKRR